MRITFLIPPLDNRKRIAERVAGCSYVIYPVPNIAILTAAALLEKGSHTVRFLECTLKGWEENDLIGFLEKDESDVYAFYSVFLSQGIDLQAAALIKKIKGDSDIVFLGPAPTYKPQEFLKGDRYYVVRGEPDISLLELINAMQDGDISGSVKGISHFKNGKIFDNPAREPIEDLDSLPFPARHLLEEREAYFNPKLSRRPFTAMYASRGCSYRCIYCVPTSLCYAREIEYKKYRGNKKPPVRLRSGKSIIEEFRLVHREGYKAVSILDDEFVWGRGRLLEICNGIKNLKIVWGCQSRADLLDEELVKSMAEAGCRYIDIGVESFNQKILDFLRKDIKVDTIEKTIKLIKKYDISAKINILIAPCPLETVETIKENLRRANKLGVDQAMFNIATPYPTTEYYELAKKEGWIVGGEYKPSDVVRECIVSYPNLNDSQIEKMARYMNLRFFLTPKLLLRHLSRLRSFSSARNLIKSVLRKLM